MSWTTLSPPSPQSTTNYLLYSQDFSQSPWTAFGGTSVLVDSNYTTAPDGTLTAARIRINSTGGGKLWQFPIGVNREGTKTASIYVKQDNSDVSQSFFGYGTTFGYGQRVRVSWLDDPPTLSLSTTGSIAASHTSGALVGISQAANGFSRIAWNANAIGPFIQEQSIFEIFPSYVSSGDHTVGWSVIVWGGQVEARAELGPYIPTTTVPSTVTDATWIKLSPPS